MTSKPPKKARLVDALSRRGVMVKMMIRSIAMLTVTLLTVEYVSYRLSSQQIVRMTEAQQAAITDVYAERIARALANIVSDLDTLRDAPSLREYYRNQLYGLSQEAKESLSTSTEVFQKLSERIPGYLFLRFHSQDGKELIRVDRGAVPVDLEKFRTSVSKFPRQAVYDGVSRSEDPGASVVVFSVGVFDKDGRGIGVIRAGYGLDTLLSKLKTEKLFETGHLAVFETDGGIIHYPGKRLHDPITAIHPGISPLIEKIKANVSGNLRVKLDSHYIIGFSAVDGQRWVVSAFVPEDEMFSVLNRIKKVVLAIVGLNIVVEIFLLAIFMQMVILKPLQNLLEVTRRIKSGDLSARVPVRSQDEIAELSNSFNEMTQSLESVMLEVTELNRTLEKKVEERTLALKNAQTQLVQTGKMTALGEMAGGVAHEVNNPLAVIKTISEQMQEALDDSPIDKELLKGMANSIESTTNRIAKIVQGLRSFSRDGSSDPFRAVDVRTLFEETLSFCEGRFKQHGIQIMVDDFRSGLGFEGRATEISQVLLNLLNNAHDAISGLQDKWIRISVVEGSDFVEIQVTDSGSGLPVEIREKVFQPFFTTKEVGKGTGMGLSISVGIVQRHKGILTLDVNCPNTRFVVRLPKKQPARESGTAV